MKQLLILLIAVAAMSCDTTPRPVEFEYKLSTIDVVPDSLQLEYRAWIIEITRAASQHMTGGDYEDPYYTIREAKRTADKLFAKEEICLRILAGTTWYNVRQSDFTPEQRIQFDLLCP